MFEPKHTATITLKAGSVLYDGATRRPYIIMSDTKATTTLGQPLTLTKMTFKDPALKKSEETKITDQIHGLGDNAETYVNEFGGRQSKLNYRFDLLDAKALFRIAAIHDRGATKYGEENWRNIPIKEQLNHALMHIYAYLAGDTQEDHLGNAACRTLFALAVSEQGGHFTNKQSEEDIIKEINKW